MLVKQMEEENLITKEHKLIICDLAGKEDVIDPKRMNEYIKQVYEKSKR